MNNKVMFTLLICFIFAVCLIFIATYKYSSFDRKKDALKKVYLRLSWETQSQFAGYYVAKYLGLYNEEGLDVIIRTSLNNVNISATVANGIDHFGDISLENLITDINNRDYPIKNVAQIFQDLDIVLLTRKEDNINELKDFNGKTYATWWGKNDVMLRTLFKKHNIPLDVVFYSGPWSLDLFINKTVAIVPAFYANEYHSVLMSGYKESDLKIFKYKDYNMNFPSGCIITSDKLISKNPLLVSKFLRASIKGWEYALAHKEETVDIMLHYAKLNKEHEAFMLDVFENNILKKEKNHFIGKHNKTRIQETINYLQEAGQISNNVTMNKIIHDDFINKIGAEILE
ncbi:MAG: ABC transporter substrate-binding protein [uncultured bacterium]|nr:MAG: ABC transporter substrate-binding protein [uncultured bacterium]